MEEAMRRRLAEEDERAEDEYFALERARFRTFMSAMRRLGCNHFRSDCVWSVSVDELLRKILGALDEADPDRAHWNNLTVSHKLDQFQSGAYPCRKLLQSGFEDRVKSAVDTLGGGDPFHAAVTPEAVHKRLVEEDEELRELLPLHSVWYYLGFAKEILSGNPDALGKRKGRFPCVSCDEYKRVIPTHAPDDGSGRPPRRLLPFERFALLSEYRKSLCRMEGPEEEEEEEEESQFLKEMREQMELRRKMQKDGFPIDVDKRIRLAYIPEFVASVRARYAVS